MIDRFIQTGYRVAHRFLVLYWSVRRPRSHGALVALWVGEELLLVRNSYGNAFFTLPGGSVHARETSREAARRELYEEAGIAVPVAALRPVLDTSVPWLNKKDRVEIFEITLDEKPVVKIDNREVIESRFCNMNEALSIVLFPPIWRYLLERPQVR